MKETLSQYMLILVVVCVMLAFIVVADPISDMINEDFKKPLQESVDKFVDQRENGPEFDDEQVITNHIIYG